MEENQKEISWGMERTVSFIEEGINDLKEKWAAGRYGNQQNDRLEDEPTKNH